MKKPVAKTVKKTVAKKAAKKPVAKKKAPKKSVRRQEGETPSATADGSRASVELQPDAAVPGSSYEAMVTDIRAAHRARRHAMGIQQVLDRKLEAYIRVTECGFHVGDSEEDRAKTSAAALALIKAAREGEGSARIIETVTMSDNSRSFADAHRLRYEKEMVAMAKRLPIAKWINSVPGLGMLGVATIIAETGDLSKYPNVAKVWKRLGYAPYNGLAGSTWKRPKWRNGEPALSAEEWTENPFNSKRYGMLFSISDSLLRKQWIGKAKTEDGKGRADGKYGEVYEKRRAHTAITHPEWTPKHSQMDGLRIMMKEVVKDLWLEWNRVTKLDASDRHLHSDAQHYDAISREPGHPMADAPSSHAGLT